MAHSKHSQFYPQEILELPMYHPHMCNRDQAEEFVKQFHQGIGSFLVRPNTSRDPSYVSITTSISDRGDSCHAKVFIQGSGGNYLYYFIEKLKFPTFRNLLEYYSNHRIHCQQQIDNIRLLRPLIFRGDQVRGTERRPLESVRENPGTGGIPIGQRYPGASRTSSHHNSFTSSRTGPSGSLVNMLNNRGNKKRSKSDGHINPFNLPHYQNSNSRENNVQKMMKCRPPAPLPRQDSYTQDEPVYYTKVDTEKNYFQEIYQFLKAAEICECGLRTVDSKLPLGWTVHRSRDEATLRHIFFQQDQLTTWDMPSEIVPHLNDFQIKFIIFLCEDAKLSIPKCLRNHLEKETTWQRNTTPSYQLGGGDSSTLSSTYSNRGSIGSSVLSIQVSDLGDSRSQLDISSASQAMGEFASLRRSGDYEKPAALVVETDDLETSGASVRVRDNLNRDSVSSERSSSGSAISDARPFSFQSNHATLIPGKIGSPVSSMSQFGEELDSQRDQLIQQGLNGEQAANMEALSEIRDLHIQSGPSSEGGGSHSILPPESLPKITLARPVVPQQPQMQARSSSSSSLSSLSQPTQNGSAGLYKKQNKSFEQFLDSEQDTHL